MSQMLSKAQRLFQALKAQEKEKAIRMRQLFEMAAGVKKSGREIDDRQAAILVRVQRTLEEKRRKGIL
jgi:hypothetical protein